MARPGPALGLFSVAQQSRHADRKRQGRNRVWHDEAECKNFDRFFFFISIAYMNKIVMFIWSLLIAPVAEALSETVARCRAACRLPTGCLQAALCCCHHATPHLTTHHTTVTQEYNLAYTVRPRRPLVSVLTSRPNHQPANSCPSYLFLFWFLFSVL